ncbi:MAG: tRNA epoxyqueuosine(34) reductase QueG [Bacillota bacterium]
MDNYDLQELKEQIKEYSRLIQVDKIGFTTGEPFYYLQELLEQHRLRGFDSGFEEKNIMLRLDPALSLPGVRSIISIAVAYPCLIPEELTDKEKPRGIFCRASWGMDYHAVLKEKLALLAGFILKLIPGVRTKAMVDTGPLSDRAVAQRAGIGWIGKNGNLITEEYGSFVFLGELLTTLPLPPDEPIHQECGQCSLCIEACPSQAINSENSTINCQKCLAFQTLNKKKLSEETKKQISLRGHIYGCDVCQLACPYNKGKTNDWHKEFQVEFDLISPKIEEIIKISNKDFQNKYGSVSGSWRGKKILQRNALLILGRHKDEKSLAFLGEVIKDDPREDIRAAAAWALGEHRTQEARRVLTDALLSEKNGYIKEEIRKALLKN